MCVRTALAKLYSYSIRTAMFVQRSPRNVRKAIIEDCSYCTCRAVRTSFAHACSYSAHKVVFIQRSQCRSLCTPTGLLYSARACTVGLEVVVVVVVVVVFGRFYIALFSSLEQTHCACM